MAGTINSNLLNSLSDTYVTYSYKEGLSNVLKIIAIASIIASINVIISFIIGSRKKDCLAILVTNIMVKTVTIFLYQILDDWIYLDNFFIVLFFIATIIIEGFIYKKILKYKKHNGMTVSAICNIVTVIIIYYCYNHFYPKYIL